MQLRDVDWKYVISNQLWATALLTIIPVVTLGIVHCALPPPFPPLLCSPQRILLLALCDLYVQCRDVCLVTERGGREWSLSTMSRAGVGGLW